MEKSIFKMLFAKVAECEEKTESPLIIFGVWLNTAEGCLSYENAEGEGFIIGDYDIDEAFTPDELQAMPEVLESIDFSEDPNEESPAFSCKDLFEAVGIIRKEL